jgi:hypothetical protein
MGGAILDWLFEHAFPWVIIVMFAGAVVFIVGGVYVLYQGRNAPTITLRKSEWVCTNTHKVPTTIYIKSGELMIPMTTYRNECLQWNRQP